VKNIGSVDTASDATGDNNAEIKQAESNGAGNEACKNDNKTMLSAAPARSQVIPKATSPIYGRTTPLTLSQNAVDNQDILKLTIKAPGQMPLHVEIAITHYDEINDTMFDIDMNVWDNAGNAIEPISLHRFHGPGNWLPYIWSAVSH
jgi:hypothetical protein